MRTHAIGLQFDPTVIFHFYLNENSKSFVEAEEIKMFKNPGFMRLSY